MELGGKSPGDCFDDADLDAVAQGVRTFGFYNAGRGLCCGVPYIRWRGIYDALVN